MAMNFKKIAVLTGGGDAPGMGVAVRAVAKAALARGIEVYGVIGGYRGLTEDIMIKLDSKAVRNKITLSGTFLYTDRYKFELPGRVEKAVENIKRHEIDGLICVGGDGTFRGATDLAEYGIPVIGIPATIDNDITGTETSIGYSTALQTLLELIDKIRDTCESHARCNVFEVMGNGAGGLAINTAIAGGAVDACIPELPFDSDACFENMMKLRRDGKRNMIVVISERRDDGAFGAGLTAKFKKMSTELAKKEGNPDLELDARFCCPGHIARGGSPVLADRLLATRMGSRAVEELLAGNNKIIICEKNGEICTSDIFFAQTVDRMYKNKPLKEGTLESFTAEERAEMDAIIAKKRKFFADSYKLLKEMAH